MTSPTAADLSPVDRTCGRCGATASMRFAGICEACRAELRTLLAREGRTIEVEGYTPKMNVTPNNVASKGD